MIVDIHIGVEGEVNVHTLLHTSVDVPDDGEVLVALPDGEQEHLGGDLVAGVDEVDPWRLLGLQLEALEVLALRHGPLQLPGHLGGDVDVHAVDDQDPEAAREAAHEAGQLLVVPGDAALSLPVEDSSDKLVAHKTELKPTIWGI